MCSLVRDILICLFLGQIMPIGNKRPEIETYFHRRDTVVIFLLMNMNEQIYVIVKGKCKFTMELFKIWNLLL